MKRWLNNIAPSLLMMSFIAALLTACGKDKPSFSLLAEQNVFTQGTVNNKLDILWVVDNSGSMQPYQQNLTSNFSSFISNFQNKGFDFHIGVTTTATYLANPLQQNNPSLARLKDGVGGNHSGVFVIDPSTPNLLNVFLTNASQGTNGSGDERAFSSFKEALDSPLNTDFRRTGAFLAVIILSDEDDFSGNNRCQNCGADHDYNAATLDSVATYTTYLDQLTQSPPGDRRYIVSNISVIDANCQSQHQASGSIMGTRYMQLTQATNGISASICDASFANSLTAIQTLIAELSTQFYLNRIPVVSSIQVNVNGQAIPQNATNGWTYESASNSIKFHGSAIPAQGSTIIVNFDPVTIK